MCGRSDDNGSNIHTLSTSFLCKLLEGSQRSIKHRLDSRSLGPLVYGLRHEKWWSDLTELIYFS